MNYNNVGTFGTISTWYISPEIDLSSGVTGYFYAQSTNGEYPDRLYLRWSAAGSSFDVGNTATSVGVFSNIAVSINENLVVDGFGTDGVWSQYTFTIAAQGAGKTGRIAFHYSLPNAGINGDNGDYIGVDSFHAETNAAQSSGKQFLD